MLVRGVPTSVVLLLTQLPYSLDSLSIPPEARENKQPVGHGELAERISLLRSVFNSILAQTFCAFKIETAGAAIGIFTCCKPPVRQPVMLTVDSLVERPSANASKIARQRSTSPRSHSMNAHSDHMRKWLSSAVSDEVSARKVA